jgi:hypothetical protein
MKNIKLSIYSILALIISLCGTARVMAQGKDTVTTEYHEEQADTSKDKKESKYDYFIRAQVEQTKMLKLGVGFGSAAAGYANAHGSSFNFFGSPFQAYIAYEYKLDPSFSLLAEARGMPWFFSDLSANFALRYYYDMEKRIKQGKSANNFSGNYFSIQQTNLVYHPAALIGVPGLELLYGLQRKLGRRGFIDVNLGPRYDLRAGQAGIAINLATGVAF